MRHIKIILAVFFFMLLLPGHAWAHGTPPPWPGTIYIPVAMMLFTLMGGGYVILKRFNLKVSLLTRRWLATFTLVGYLVMFGDGYSGWILVIIFALLALGRGLHLIFWGIKSKGKIKPDHLFEANALRLIPSGILLIITTACLSIYPLTFPYSPSWTEQKGFDPDAKSNLHNLYFGCKAYWADKGSQNDCDVSIVKGTTYGYVQSKGMVIEANGGESTFSATAFHERSQNIYKIDVNGSIDHYKKRKPEAKKAKNPSDWIKNIKDNLRSFLY